MRGRRPGVVRVASAVAVALALAPGAGRAQSIDALVEQFRAIDPDSLQTRFQGASRPDAPDVERPPKACFVYKGDKDNTGDELVSPLTVQAEVAAFWALLELVQNEENRQDALTGSATFGFTGNTVPQGAPPAQADGTEKVSEQAADQFKVNLGINLDRGFYPGRFEFTSRVDVRLQGGTFEEDLTNLRIAYDYYTRPGLEIYGFANRLSDSFMNIEQRYEAGTGLVVDSHRGGHFSPAGPGTPGHKKARDLHDAVFRHRFGNRRRHAPRVKPDAAETSARDTVRTPAGQEADTAPAQGSPEDTWGITGPPQWYRCLEVVDAKSAAEVGPRLGDIHDDLHALWASTEEAFHQRYSRVRTAFLVGVAAEIQQSSLKRTTTTKEEAPAGETGVFSRTRTESFSPAAEQDWRLNFRPTFEFRPDARWMFRAHSYIMPTFPLSKSDRLVRAADGTFAVKRVNDIRFESQVRAELTVGDATPGQPGDVKLVATWDNYWDTAPPAVITVDADGAVSGLSAPYKHNIVSLTLNVTWK